jgi:hypothetical protein
VLDVRHSPLAGFRGAFGQRLPLNLARYNVFHATLLCVAISKDKVEKIRARIDGDEHFEA